MADKTGKDLTDNLSSTSKLMLAMEAEIQQVKSGELELDRARSIVQMRRLQLRVSELNLQYNRLIRTARSHKIKEMPLIEQETERPAASELTAAIPKSDDEPVATEGADRSGPRLSI